MVTEIQKTKTDENLTQSELHKTEKHSENGSDKPIWDENLPMIHENGVTFYPGLEISKCDKSNLQAYKNLDTDNNGILSTDELKSGLTSRVLSLDFDIKRFKENLDEPAMNMKDMMCDLGLGALIGIPINKSLFSVFSKLVHKLDNVKNPKMLLPGLIALSAVTICGVLAPFATTVAIPVIDYKIQASKKKKNLAGKIANAQEQMKLLKAELAK